MIRNPLRGLKKQCKTCPDLIENYTGNLMYACIGRKSREPGDCKAKRTLAVPAPRDPSEQEEDRRC